MVTKHVSHSNAEVMQSYSQLNMPITKTYSCSETIHTTDTTDNLHILPYKPLDKKYNCTRI